MLRADIFGSRFLLASHRIEAILLETTIARRGRRLGSVKDAVGLGNAYGAALEQIKAQGGEKTKLAMATLTWICHAERPLQVDELRHALAVQIGATHFDSANAPSIGALIVCCQGLIKVNKETSTVRLIHPTVQEYLCAHPDLFSQPHSVIAETCLTYLNSEHVRNLSFHPLPGHQVTPFLKYSSRYWGIHANKELSDHGRALALELLNQYEYHVSGLSLLNQVLPPRNIESIGASTRFAGLHCASFFGILELVTSSIDAKSCEINQGDCAGNTPLLWAVKNGHDRVVKLLLGQKDIDPNCLDKSDRTALGCAVIEGNEEAIKLLLSRKDVDPNHQDENNQTPLGCAATQGHVSVVELLLKREDIEPDRPDNQGGTPLFLAANSGHEGVVELLLGRKDVDPNRQNKKNRTPLRAAAYEGHEEVVKILLERGDVDPNRPDDDDRTPLGSAALKGHVGVVKLLLGRHDVDLNWLDIYDTTPLAWAATKGHREVVKLLLEQEGVEPNRPDNHGGTPLFWAAHYGHEGVVKLLLGRKDVDPNRPKNDNRTPLRAAAYKGHEGVVELLLEREDVDPNRPDDNDRTPLGSAAIKGHTRVVWLLPNSSKRETNILRKSLVGEE